MRVLGLLWGHVIVRAHHLAALGQRLRGGLSTWIGWLVDAGQTHVQNLDGTLAVQQEIAGLDVPVDHALFMGALEPSGQVLWLLGTMVGREAVLERGQLVGREQPGSDKVLDELSEANGDAGPPTGQVF